MTAAGENKNSIVLNTLVAFERSSTGHESFGGDLGYSKNINPFSSSERIRKIHRTPTKHQAVSMAITLNPKEQPCPKMNNGEDVPHLLILRLLGFIYNTQITESFKMCFCFSWFMSSNIDQKMITHSMLKREREK